MAASIGKKRHKNAGLCVSVALKLITLLFIVPFCDSLSIQTEEIKLNIPHNAEIGFNVFRTELNVNCLNVDHIQKHRGEVINPFTINSDGYLATKESLVNNIGDLFVLRPKSTDICRNIDVSVSFPVHIEITHDRDNLKFFYDHYEGYIADDAQPNTKVQSIEHLYACSATVCRNNLDYRIKGSNGFYLETVSRDGQIEIEIYTKIHAALLKDVESLIIIAENVEGQQGHTNVDIRRHHDTSLRFVPLPKHRHRRATQETLPNQQVKENQTGLLFSLPTAGPGQTYQLARSTYKGAFAVSPSGAVSVVDNFRLDYDELNANASLSTTVQIIVSLLDANDIVVKEYVQDIEIQDVNDELPEFTNIPKPFYAAVNLNAQANILVYTLTAEDRDTDSRILLEVDSTQNDASVDKYFRINIQENVANILRKGSEQFTQENEKFNVHFTATDLNAPADTPQRTQGVVQILAGRRSPQFMNQTYVIHFVEQTEVGLTIGQDVPIQVKSFQSKRIMCLVLNQEGQSSEFFSADYEVSNNEITSCKITVKRVIDYEKGPREFNVTLQAIEEETGKITDQLVQIIVTDKNEYQPTFTKSAYTKDNVLENVPVGTTILTVTSTDHDYNSQIQFSVDSDLFRIEAKPSTNEIHQADLIVAKPLDYDFISPKNYEFNVFATDNGQIIRTGRATIQIFMRDVNDEYPKFPDAMTTQLRYDAAVGQEVYYVNAFDADAGDKVTYQFATSYSKFGIDPESGRITLRNTIAQSQDQIQDFVYELQVIATDDGGCCGKVNQLSSTGTVTVSIMTDNLHRPQFENCNQYNPSVDEEIADAFVIRVEATDQDSGSYGKVTYSIRDPDSKFRINSTTGDLYTKVKIDRETDLIGTTKLVVNVVARDGGNSENVCSLLVLINDVNDNDPIFISNIYNVTINNQLSVNKVAAYIEAKDKDIQNNSQVTYSFSADGNPGNYFKFDIPSYTGQIKVAKALPLPTVINLIVIAADGGVPSRRTNATVRIMITNLDANQPPTYYQSFPADFKCRIKEDVTQGSTVLNFTAVSNAQGNNALTFKTIYADTEDEVFSAKKGPDSSSAEITGLFYPKMNLDYETKQFYRVTLRASDINDMYSDRIVDVEVEDVNDNIPEFPLKNVETGWLEVDLNEGDYTGSLTEVFKIQAIDNDGTSPNNLIQSYVMEENKNFTINSVTGMIYTQSMFDRETEPHIYSVTVYAIDGAPSAFDAPNHNSGQVTVKITIKDVNDNPPKFKQDNYQFNASEDIQNNQNIPGAFVEAEDPDSDADLSYNIRAISQPVPFTVQRQTGEIIVVGLLDYDLGPAYREYIFEVIVDDSLNSATTTVTVSITDVNDNSPVVEGKYIFNDFVEENPNDIGPIATVTATDKDNDGVNKFYFRLSFPDKADEQYFSIGAESGVLSIIKQLDRDLPNGKADFAFTVVVADAPEASGNALLGYGEVQVKPLDINDNDPFFPEEDLQLSVAENQTIGTLVGRVKAMDYDFMENGTVSIEMVEMRPENVFRLDNNSLLLYTTAVLDREVIDTYYVVVKATDHGPSPRSGTGTLTVSVRDINDNAPFFNQSYHFYLSEHQTSGEIGRIKAIDLDIGINANITYTIADKDATHFQMDSDRQLNEGILKIYEKVDYDDPSQRRFNVTAYAVDPNPGGADFSRRAETYIIIDVSDYNDEVPTFVEAQKTIEVLENQTIGYFLADFNATDKDVNPEYGSFEYYIQRESDPDRRFMIEQKGTIGTVRIQHLLDRETKANHRVTILAIDNVNGSPQNTGTATLIVNVLDVNDNFPDFADDYKLQIKENIPLNNHKLIDLKAVDADDSNHGTPFFFELMCSEATSSQCSKFRLDFIEGGVGSAGGVDGMGQLFVTGEFDREVEREIVLPIRLCDRHGKNDPEQQCGIRYLTVTIENENDNPIGEGTQFITVFNYKGMFGNIVIGTVNTNDLDDPDEPTTPVEKRYNLLNEDVAGKFVLVAQDSGRITLLPNVPELSFVIKVSVEDLKFDVTKTSTVNINIVFVDDDAVFNAGSVRIEGVTAEEFITKPKQGDSMLGKVQKKFAEKLYGSNREIDNVQILSVMGQDTHTDVMIAAHGSPYYQRSRMEGIVASNREEFNALLNTEGVATGTIDMVPIDMCQFESCEGGCFNELLVQDTPTLVDTNGASYVGVNTQINGTCGCRATTFPSTVECTPGYCYHGGACEKDRWGVVSCTCPEGFEGPRCQKLRQSFDGTGYALYRPLEQCEESRTSIEILTTKPNGLILYNGPVSDLTPSDPRDFVSLELVGGHPRLRINHGTGEVSLSINGGSRLSDGTWHRIDIFRQKKNVRMTIDHCVNSINNDRADCEVSGVTKGENIYINAVDPLQLGGRMSQPSYPADITNQKFDGCLKNLIHNAEIYDLSTGGQFPGAVDGCKREDDACAAPCNNGQCNIIGGVPGNIEAVCICDPGFRSSGSESCNTVTSVRDFAEQSYLDWNIKNTYVPFLDNKKMEITFQFRSRDRNGLIFSVTDELDGNKFVKFMIVDSRLLVIYNLGDDRYELPLMNVPQVNDGQWHTVTLERYGKQFILKMDSGEGRYYADTLGPINGAEIFKIRQDQLYAGASLSYFGASVSITGDDFNSSCMNDIRYDNAWFPMTTGEASESVIATVNRDQNTRADCVRNDCSDFKCPSNQVCLPLWEAFDCVCEDGFYEFNGACVPYCDAFSPCFTGVCLNQPLNGLPYTCRCTAPWRGPQCQCHPTLNPGGDACIIAEEFEETAAMAGGIIAAIILGILFLLVVIVIIAYLLFKRRQTESKEPFDEDMEDDIRENVMYYDEEGAGEEDQTQYDLSRLRKPDDGEHPSTWDAPDVPISTKPLGAAADRPDVGDFIHTRLNDADDDPNSPPYDTPHDFNYEGGSSDAGSLSSLNTSSTGSQDYDYLNEWGPKFAKLADMYNNYDNDD